MTPFTQAVIPPSSTQTVTSSPVLISIIIVSYNTSKVTLECLHSLMRSIKSVDELINQTEIIIVDNASTDDSVTAIRHWFSSQSIRHSVLSNMVNLGFARANNQGMMQAKGEFIWLLNSDALVGKHALSHLITLTSKNERQSLYAASLWNVDGQYQPQGGDLPGYLSLFCFALMLDDVPIIGRFFPSIQHTGRRAKSLKQPLTSMGWVAGTALFFPSAVATQIGMLDEEIFMYAEDIDFCWRAHAANIPSYIVRDVKVVHLGSASSSAAKARQGEFRSLAYLIQKHFSPGKAKWCLRLLKTAALTRKFVFARLNQPDRSLEYHTIATSDIFREI